MFGTLGPTDTGPLAARPEPQSDAIIHRASYLDNLPSYTVRDGLAGVVPNGPADDILGPENLWTIHRCGLEHPAIPWNGVSRYSE